MTTTPSPSPSLPKKEEEEKGKIKLKSDLLTPLPLLAPTDSAAPAKTETKEGEDIVFEDFARLRRGMSVDNN